MEIKYIKGDATRPIGEGRKLLIHCCNDCGDWGSGFVLAISKRWKEPESQYRKWSNGQTSVPCELGQVQFVKVEDDIVVSNMIGQHGIKHQNGNPPIRYEAIVKCLEKVKDAAIKNKASIHLPYLMCCDRAGGKWDIIEGHIKDIFCKNDIEVTVYDFKNTV